MPHPARPGLVRLPDASRAFHRGKPSPLTRAFLPVVLAGVLHQDATHQGRCDGAELSAVLRRDPVFNCQFQVSLVNKSSCLKRVVRAFPTEVIGRPARNSWLTSSIRRKAASRSPSRHCSNVGVTSAELSGGLPLLENLLFLVFKMKFFLCPEAQVVAAEAENIVIHSPVSVSGRALQRLRAKTRDLHQS